MTKIKNKRSLFLLGFGPNSISWTEARQWKPSFLCGLEYLFTAFMTQLPMALIDISRVIRTHAYAALNCAFAFIQRGVRTPGIPHLSERT